MAEPNSSTTFRTASWFVVLAVAAVLYLAQAVFIPLALALLLAFLLAPLIRFFERVGLRRTPAVAAIVLLSASVLAGVISLVVLQAVDLAEKLPNYRETMDMKFAGLRGKIEGVERLTRLLDVLEKSEPEDQSLPTSKGEPPVRVRIVENRLQVLGAMAGPLLAPLATAGLVLAFVIFMLMQWDDLRDRILRVSGQGRLSLTTRALEDASKRVSYYLQIQLLINAMVGIVFGLGLAVIGIPNAPLAAVLLTTLRFIPYIGAWIAACFPLFIAFAAKDGWTPLLLSLGLFGALEILAAQVLEPWFYRSKTGLSPVGVLISFLFWGWMWGGVGLLLATPLTVCVVVAGQYIPQLEMISILLSDQRALPPWARLYHRLLALDTDEAASIVDAARTRARNTAELYDDTLAPALAIAERDRQSEQLSGERTRIVFGSLEHFARPHAPEDPFDRRRAGSVDVLCIPARGDGDFIASLMAAQVLEEGGLVAMPLSNSLTMSEIIEKVATEKPRLVLVGALPQLATVSVHECSRKLRALFPELPILAGVWGSEDVSSTTASRWKVAGIDQVVSRFDTLNPVVRSMLETPSRPLRASAV